MDHKQHIILYATRELKRLRDQKAVISSEYETFLNRLSNGLCMTCSADIKVVNVENFDDGFKYTFKCGHGWINKTIHESITVKDNQKMRLKRPGYKKFAWELLQGWFPSFKFPKGVYQKRLIDKINDHYEHLIVDEKTGKTDHYESEPLSKHMAKTKKVIRSEDE